MNRLFLVITLTFIALTVAACETKTSTAAEQQATPNPIHPTTPEATVARLLELAESGDWETYVDDFYGETHKFKGEGDRDALVSRFEGKWGPKAIESLRLVKNVKSALSENGKQAVFKVDDRNM